MLGELGRIYFQGGDYQKALAVLKPAVGMDDSDPDAMFYLSRTYLELGYFEEASGLLSKVVKKYPDFTEAYYFLGNAYGRQENMKEAHYYLGVFYARRGRLKSAVFHLTRAQEMAETPERKEEIEMLLERINNQIARSSKPSQ